MRALLVIVLTLLAAPVASAATVMVDDSDITSDGASSPWNCGSALNKCGTIQRGIDHASAGDIISVAPGSYTLEDVNVNKPVELRGAQSGVDARSRTVVAANESVVTGPGGQTGFHVTVSGVTIDGFVVQGNTSSTQGAGIYGEANLAGLVIENNVIQNNIAGVIFGSDHTTITHNLIANNNNAGTLSGTGIYTDQLQAGNTLTDVRVEENDFTNNQNAGILFGSTDVTKPADDVVISGNRFPTANGNAVLLFSIVNLDVTDNVIGPTVASALVLGGNVSQADLTGNSLSSGPTRGIRMGDFGGGGANTGVAIIGNTIRGYPTGIDIDPTQAGLPTIRGNRISGNTTAGLTTALANVVATYNWWGCNGGPGATGCDVVTGTGAGTASTTPRTVLSVAASPTSIPASGGATTITANLSKANDGSAAGNGVPEGTAVALSTSLGALPASATTAAGLATATLTSGAGYGTATVTATLDNQSATTSVTIRPGDSDGDGRADNVDCAPADATKPAAGAVADANCDGVADPAPGGGAVADTTPPVITQGRISRGRLHFTVNERALVQVVVKRKKGKRFVRAAATAVLAKQGANTVRLPGHPKRGRARVTLMAFDAAGNRAKALTLKV